MKLRNFHYINKKLLDDYIAAIDGYVYEEETQKLNETNQKTAGAKAGAFGVSGDGKYENSHQKNLKEKYISAMQQNLINYSTICRQMNIPH